MGLERWEVLTSRTLPTRVFCCSSSETPVAVLMLVFSMLMSPVSTQQVTQATNGSEGRKWNLLEDMIRVERIGDFVKMFTLFGTGAILTARSNIED